MTTAASVEKATSIKVQYLVLPVGKNLHVEYKASLAKWKEEFEKSTWAAILDDPNIDLSGSGPGGMHELSAILDSILNLRPRVLQKPSKYCIASFKMNHEFHMLREAKSPAEAFRLITETKVEKDYLRGKLTVYVTRDFFQDGQPWRSTSITSRPIRPKAEIPHVDEISQRFDDDREVQETPFSQGVDPELIRRYEDARSGFVKEFGLLSSEEIAKAAHSRAGNKSLTASKWRQAGKIFAVRYEGRVGYPRFQLEPKTGRPKTVIAKVVATFPKDVDGWEVALWLGSPNTRLSGKRPVDILDTQPDRVAAVAEAKQTLEVF